MKIVAIIQARMTSSRLPGKVMMPIGDKPLIQLMIERVQRSRYINKIVVAMPQDDKCDELQALCEKLGVSVFKGSETDVLSRFAGAAKQFQAEIVVRLTSDCPFLDPALIDHTVEGFQKGDFDYFNNIKDRTYPDGQDVEIFTAAALYRADLEARHPKHREHVTTYIDGRIKDISEKGDFCCGSIGSQKHYGHLMWSVNTPEELEHVRDLYRKLSDKNNFSWIDVLKLEGLQEA